jgi:hypothetical protein
MLSFSCVICAVEPPLVDRSTPLYFKRTQNVSPKLIVSIQFDVGINQDTSQLRTAYVSPKGVL